MAYTHGGNHGHVAQLGGKIEISLAALAHEGDSVLRFAGIGGGGISVKQVGHSRPRSQAVHELDKQPAQRITQVEVHQLVVDVTVQNDDLDAAPPPFVCDDQAKVEGVQQVKKMTGQRDVPSAHILVAAVHWLSRHSNAPLAFEYAMHKTFPVLCGHDHVVPEGKKRGLHACGL